MCCWPKCYHVLNWFFLPKSGFLEFIWIFSGKNHLKINISHILNPNLTKKIPLNPPHQDLSNNTKGTLQFLQNFQLQFNLIFSEKNHSILKNFYNASPNTIKLSRCTPPHWELSKETKNTIWSILIRWISLV